MTVEITEKAHDTESMPHENEGKDSPKSEAASNKSDDNAATEAAQKQAAKRRTKTGCLTCRKRRIKCGEEKPICKNCIKSKRDCAGYVQPLVYRQQNQGPQPDIRDPSGRSYSAHDDPFNASYFNNPPQPGQPFLGPYSTIDPTGALPYQSINSAHYAQNTQMAPPGAIHQSNSAAGQYYAWQANQMQSTPLYHSMDTTARVAPMFQMPYHDSTSSNQLSLDPTYVSSSIYSEAQSFSHDQTPLSAINPSPHEFSDQRHFFDPTQHRPAFMPQPYGVLQADIVENDSRKYNVHGFVQPPTLSSIQSGALATAPVMETQGPGDEYEDPEDPYDIEMEDRDISFQDAAQNLTEILGRSGQGSWQQSKRQVSKRQQQQTLVTFRPKLTLSPLQDERNERIFCHFVEVSSHCMSIYERHHFSPIAAPARTLWNFTIPALALSHAALAHAILALGALHLAKLQGTSEDLAVKHFTYSVRRVGKLLGLPNRRHEIATLATVLVLGFYEVVTGDHSRWNLHLRGATKLVLEHDYAGMTKIARRMRSGAKARVNQWTAQFALTEENYGRVAGIPLALLDDVDWEVNTGLVSQLTGVPIDYDSQFQPQFPPQDLRMNLSDKDVEDFKAKMDLRWWYCKQDIFQSMISGDQLLMPYDEWIYCPPRGQFGRADNPYATLDHFMLAMARLVDFGGKDRDRKQRAVKAQGGQWKPPGWLFGPQGPPGPPGSSGPPRHGPPGSRGPPQGEPRRGSGTSSQSATSRKNSSSTKSDGVSVAKPSPAPSANEGRVRQSRPGPPGGPGGPPGMPNAGNTPPMYGMIPPGADVQVHSAFKNMDASIHDPAFQPVREGRKPTPTTSLEEDTAKAFAEHAEITKAFDFFKSSLGADFEPLKQSATQPLATPFGPGLIFRNAGVAGIWLFYHVGRILLWRFHPEMPPAAMVSAGVTAHLSKEHAQTVGKICAGLYSTQHYGQSADGALDPQFAGALMESTFQLLFAAVQYQDAAQRGWTITKLQDVARRCGWQTSGAVAAACELAWEKMGQAGRGPPYERTLDHKNKDARVSGAYSRSDRPVREPSQGSNPVSEYESEFVNHDRSLIDRSSSTRTHWALGLLSVEEDIKKMSLGEE